MGRRCAAAARPCEPGGRERSSRRLHRLRPAERSSRTSAGSRKAVGGRLTLSHLLRWRAACRPVWTRLGRRGPPIVGPLATLEVLQGFHDWRHLGASKEEQVIVATRP